MRKMTEMKKKRLEIVIQLFRFCVALRRKLLLRVWFGDKVRSEESPDASLWTTPPSAARSSFCCCRRRAPSALKDGRAIAIKWALSQLFEKGKERKGWDGMGWR
jgi:hypothetical protein